MSSSKFRWFLAFTLIACGPAIPDPADTDGPDDTDDHRPSPWVAVEQALADGVASGELPGFQLVVRGPDGTVTFRQAGGAFSDDQSIPFDSAIKPVTGAVILTLVRDGALDLDDTLGMRLGWTGPEGEVTVRHLLTFTSGLVEEPPCIPLPPRLVDGELVVPGDRSDFATCAARIREGGLTRPPGEAFLYGPTHQHLLAHLAESVADTPWRDLFEQKIRAPLRLGDADIRYANGRVAAGAVGRADALAAILGTLAEDGGLVPESGAASLLPAELAREYFTDDTRTRGVEVAESPWGALDLDVHFGLGIWVYCEDYARPDTCLYLGSGGNGTTAWIDPQTGHVGVLVLYQGTYTGYQDGYRWMTDLLPHVRGALSSTGG